MHLAVGVKMEIKDLEPGQKLFAALARTALAVLSRRHDDWCVYVGGVQGETHDMEWHDVARMGDKQSEIMARSIVENYFPQLEIGDLPYAR